MSAAELAIRGGALHLAHAAYERFFAGVGAVVLLREGADLLVLPVRSAAAGGYVLKVRNAAGDRVVAAADFLRAQGLEDETEVLPSFSWQADRHALLVQHVFPAPSQL
jgi:hypothetical protein